MSRAPAPVKIDTAAAPAMDTTNMNPYGLQTYGMMPSAPNPATDSPIHAMQNMYGNMQVQQQQQHQHQQMLQQQQLQQMQQHQMASSMYPHGQTPNTTQNVSVVDFKPDVMAQQHMADMQHKYQNQVNSMTPTNAPASMGLIGRDGRYIPATAAAPYVSSDSDPYGNAHMDQYGSYMNTARHLPYQNSSGPNTNTMMHRNSINRSNSMNRCNTMGYPNSMARSNTMARANTMARSGTMSHSDMKHREIQRRSNEIAASVRNNAKIQSRATGANSAKAMTALIDERIGTHASAVSAANNASTVSSRALSDMIDERLRVSNSKISTSAPAVSQREIKSLIDERVRKIVPKFTASQVPVQASIPQVAAAVPTSPFHGKTAAEQRAVVSNAVHEVMNEFGKKGAFTASPYPSYPRKNTSASGFSDRERIAAGRYSRGESF